MQTPRLMHNKDCTTRTYHHHIQVSSIHHDAGGGVKKDVKKKGIRDEASGLRKGEGGGGGVLNGAILGKACVGVCV